MWHNAYKRLLKYTKFMLAYDLSIKNIYYYFLQY